MGQCVTKISHSCGTRDGLQVFEGEDGKLNGFCFSCGTYVGNPYGEPRTIDFIPKEQRLTKTKEELEQELAEIGSCVSMDLPTRRLRKPTLDAFGVKVGVSETDGKTPRLVYFPYTKDGRVTRYKVRLLEEKRMWNVYTDLDTDLFGWEQALEKGAKRLIITEGEYDAMAVDRIIEMQGDPKYRDMSAVVSIPNGAANAARDLSKVADKIKKHFKEVSFCFDNDEPGKKALQECLKLFPYATSVNLPAKDANDCLGSAKLMKAAHSAIVFNASVPKNTRIVHGRELRELAKKKPEYGLSYPWPGLTKLTRGIRRGETVYWGAGVKMGKSEVVNALGGHQVKEHGLPILLCKPEEDKVKSYQMLLGKLAGRIFHDPDAEFDEEAFDEADKAYGDKIIIVDNYQFVNWDSLKDDIRYVINNEGVQDVYIDPVTCFTSGMSSSDTNEFLVGWSAELAAMAKDLNFTANIFCHLKAPTNGAPHERGGEVLSTQFTGSRAMMRSCHMMVGLEGNKDPELPEIQRNIRNLKILEDRNFGASGIVKLYWDHRTGLFNEMHQ
jgi:twinkle protein